MYNVPPLFAHQIETVDFLSYTPRVFDMSDPGTGKTRAHLEDFWRRRKAGGGKGLVIAPKSILQVAWGDDVIKFVPGLRCSIAYAQNREKAFRMEADIYITNHDAVKWLTNKNCPLPKDYWDDFDILIIDESTAFKHNTSQRSKALRKLAVNFPIRRGLTGTPNSNSITDVHHQMLLLDDGERLGSSFWRFRNEVCEPVQVGPSVKHVKWTDRPGAEGAVFDLIRDMSIRHKLEECIDIPPNHQWDQVFDLPPKLMQRYQEMLNFAVTESESGKKISAVYASSLNQKLLQIASGAVYTGFNDYVELDDSRASLILDLVEERPHSIVVFIWKHQRDQLLRLAKKRGVTHFLIDGSVTSDKKRAEAVRDFQAGNLQAGFIHPASAAHGLTLTRGVATIMASPTHNAEHWKQVFHRIYRASQTHKTETIHVRGRGTIDEEVYEDKLGPKLDSMTLFLGLVQQAKGQ